MAEFGTPDPSSAPATTWYQPAESLKTSDPEVWSSFENGIKSGAITDLPSLIKKGIGAEKRLGIALVPPGKDAKPEEIKAFAEKVYSTGHIKAPAAYPDSPDGYELNLEVIPENIRSDELLGEYRALAHKHGITAEAANELFALNAKQFSKIQEAFNGNKAQAEARISEMAKAEGKDMTAVMEAGRRAADFMMKKSPQDFEVFGHAFKNNPSVLWGLSILGEAIGEDTSQLGDGGGTQSGEMEAAYQEARAIRFDPAHPKHAQFLAEGINGPLHDQIDNAYKKRFGSKEE